MLVNKDWLARACERMHRNKAAVALANKLARISWSIQKHKTAFDAQRDEVVIGVRAEATQKSSRQIESMERKYYAPRI